MKRIRIAGKPFEYRFWIDDHEITDSLAGFKVEMDSEGNETGKVNLKLVGEIVYGEPEDEPIDMSGFGEPQTGSRPIRAEYDIARNEYLIERAGGGRVRITGEALYRHAEGVSK